MKTRRSLRSLSLPQRLAALAFILGALALFGEPFRGNVATVDLEELALAVAGEADHVTARELADWILAGRSDYRLLDLRPGAEYAKYHIPPAESAPLAGLLDVPLARNERIVLYSDGGIHGAQAWLLLRAKGYPAVYSLLGGLEGWRNEVLFPALPDEATAEGRAEAERMRFVSGHFGGTPRDASGAATAPAAFEMPKVEAPAAAPAASAPAPKKKKEGC